jgi:hypothetical protein
MAISSELDVGIGCADVSVGNVAVSGGMLCVTNSTRSAKLKVQHGTVNLGTGGVLVVDDLQTNTCGYFTNSGGGILLSSDAFHTTNLLLNPGAEYFLDYWTQNGNFSSGNVATPHSGDYEFISSGTSPGFLSQTVNLVGSGIPEAKLNSGQLAVYVSFWEQTLHNQSSMGQPDDAQVTLAFRDASANVISSVSTPEIEIDSSDVWSNYTAHYLVPVGTHFIDYMINFVPYAKVDTDTDIVLVDDNLLLVTQLPSLKVSIAGPNVVLTWPAWGRYFNLEFSTDLSTPNSWQSVTDIPVVTPAGLLVVTTSPPGPECFYRLRSQ